MTVIPTLREALAFSSALGRKSLDPSEIAIGVKKSSQRRRHGSPNCHYHPDPTCLYFVPSILTELHHFVPPMLVASFLRSDWWWGYLAEPWPISARCLVLRILGHRDRRLEGLLEGDLRLSAAVSPKLQYTAAQDFFSDSRVGHKYIL